MKLREQIAKVIAEECAEPNHAMSKGYLHIADQLLSLLKENRWVELDENQDLPENTYLVAMPVDKLHPSYSAGKRFGYAEAQKDMIIAGWKKTKNAKEG